MTETTKQSYQERILKVLLYIQNNLDNPLTLEELSAIAFFSPFHFHRIFTAHTNESIKSYIRRLRLERAKRDLSFTDLSITQISERAGYDTQQSFHRAFKEAYHDTPKHYRNYAVDLIKQASSSHATIPSVTVKRIAPIKVAFVRHTGSYANVLPAWHELIEAVGLNYFTQESTLKISIAHDAPDDDNEDKLRYDACVSIQNSEQIKPSGKIGIQTLSGGKHAIIRHHGSLKDIEKTYIALFGAWLPQSGYEPADAPNFIIHQNMPFVIPESELITDICLPIQ